MVTISTIELATYRVEIYLSRENEFLHLIANINVNSKNMATMLYDSIDKSYKINDNEPCRRIEVWLLQNDTRINRKEVILNK